MLIIILEPLAPNFPLCHSGALPQKFYQIARALCPRKDMPIWHFGAISTHAKKSEILTSSVSNLRGIKESAPFYSNQSCQYRFILFILQNIKGYVSIALKKWSHCSGITAFECPLTAGLSINCILTNTTLLSNNYRVQKTTHHEIQSFTPPTFLYSPRSLPRSYSPSWHGCTDWAWLKYPYVPWYWKGSCNPAAVALWIV